MKMIGIVSIAIPFILSAGSLVRAQPAHPIDSTIPSLFQRGHFEATLASGILFSPFVATKNRPTVNYTLSEAQFGYMLTDVRQTGPVRGNFELVGAGFGGAVVKGKGNCLSGLTVWMRYNVVPRHGPFTPYIQAGGGVTYADVNRRLVGERFNFNLDIGAGVRCFVTHNWSVNLEYRFQHVSNADLSRHNIGLNADGPMLGVSCFF